MQQQAAVRDFIVRRLSWQLGVAPEAVTESATLGDLGADSLDHVEFVMELEEEYGIEIEDRDAEALEPKPVSAWVAFVEGRLR